MRGKELTIDFAPQVKSVIRNTLKNYRSDIEFAIGRENLKSKSTIQQVQNQELNQDDWEK